MEGEYYTISGFDYKRNVNMETRKENVSVDIRAMKKNIDKGSFSYNCLGQALKQRGRLGNMHENPAVNV